MFRVRAYYKPTPSNPDGEVDDLLFMTEIKTRSWCKEEVKWESCERVVCEQLNIDMEGDFAT